MRNISFGKPMIDDRERFLVNEVLQGDILVHGPRAKEFESKFASYTGAPFVTSTSSCTSALHLCYFYLQLGKGDEVIVPAQTHNATAHSVELTDAKPIFVDAELETGNIDITQIENNISEKTKAISVVHYLGMPVDMEKILQIANKYDLKVIEDCALAIGSYYKDKHVGLWGDAGCYSFYPVKHFTTGEGGMLISKHKELVDKITRQKAFGVDRTMTERSIPGMYDVTMLGFNYRMSEIHAAIGIVQLDKIDFFLKTRKENYELLSSLLREIPEISQFKSTEGDFKSSYYCHSILLEEKLVSKRIEIVEYFKKNGVGTSIYYPRPVPHFTYYKNKYGYSENSFPNASKISYSSIALPVGPHLNLEDMQFIIKILKEAIVEVKK
ncbi:MAG: DegT/DnrJ/EryC1/StrS family aminotransferase [Leptospiraceae bacterium]|nr:DegT/DnrJ/EryC1/StrS family aminotransferase [Leptospiraceae bacterium]